MREIINFLTLSAVFILTGYAMKEGGLTALLFLACIMSYGGTIYWKRQRGFVTLNPVEEVVYCVGIAFLAIGTLGIALRFLKPSRK